MHQAVILLGSNTGDLTVNLSHAISMIAGKAGVVKMRSNIYKTDPWGKEDQPAFYNQVIAVQTSLTARQLLNCLLEIEHQMGRKRTEKWQPRIIDLDILYYDSEIIDEEGLTVPHPELHKRRFTLVPLSEILPDFIHPVLRKTNAELLFEVKDGLAVEMLKREMNF